LGDGDAEPGLGEGDAELGLGAGDAELLPPLPLTATGVSSVGVPDG
jgi:hypothetical protein